MQEQQVTDHPMRRQDSMHRTQVGMVMAQIERVFREGETTYNYGPLLRLVRASSLERKFPVTHRHFHNALDALVRQGKLVRYGEYVYSSVGRI